MDTFGWDVVYACSGHYLNDQLSVTDDGGIRDFNYADTAISVSGRFGPWRLVPGGSGPIVQFEMPIVAGSVTIKTTQQQFSLNGCVPLVQLQLKLAKGKTQEASHHLVFHCTTLGKGKGDATPGAVSVLDPDTSGNLKKQTDGAIAAALLVTGLGNCLVAHADQLTYVFARILPAPTGQNSDWLTPTTVTYGYHQPKGGALGGIAILGMLAGTDRPPPYFDPQLLEGYDFGFALSARALLQHVIIPSLAQSLQGNAWPGDFAVRGNSAITLINSFNLNPVHVGALDYIPEVQNLVFEIQETSMRCYIATKTPITGLLYAYVTNSVQSINPARFDPGSRRLSFLSDPNMSVTQDKYIPWWESVLGALTFGLMNAIVAAISLAIENSVGGVVDSKTASSLGAVAPGLVSWHGENEVAILNGGLASNIFMQGKMR